VQEKPAPAAENQRRRQETSARERRQETRESQDSKAGRRRAGKLELVVTPWGEVLIDGKSRGISSGAKAFDLPPGAHTIEIRNSTFPAYVQKVQVKPGEAVRIRHRSNDAPRRRRDSDRILAACAQLQGVLPLSKGRTR